MSNITVEPIKLKIKYAHKKKTKYENEPDGSFENRISLRRPGRPRNHGNPNKVRKTTLETKINENQKIPQITAAVNEEQQWTQSENNICKKIELIDFGRESNTSNESLNLIINEGRNIQHTEIFSNSSQSFIDNDIDTLVENNQPTIMQDTIIGNAFNFIQPSNATNIYQNYSYNEPTFSSPNNQNFHQTTMDQQLREKDAYIHQLQLLNEQAKSEIHHYKIQCKKIDEINECHRKNPYGKSICKWCNLDTKDYPILNIRTIAYVHGFNKNFKN